jgi:hypothetical protein
MSSKQYLGYLNHPYLPTLLALPLLAIPVALLILSAVPPSFNSCPRAATWIIVFSAVCIFSILLDLLFRHLTFGFATLALIIRSAILLFFLAWDAYGIWLLAVGSSGCRQQTGWALYNYIMMAILVAVDLLVSLGVFIGLATSFVQHLRGVTRPTINASNSNQNEIPTI